MANKQNRLPPLLRYTPGELAKEWDESISYIWQQIEAGRLKAQARDDQGQWREVEPKMGIELDFGARGLTQGETVIFENGGVGPSKEFRWSRGNVRITHEARKEFEQLAIQESLHVDAQTVLSPKEKENLLKQLACLAMLLAEKSQRLKRSEKPNASQIAKDVNSLTFDLNMSNLGISETEIRSNISAGLKLLKEKNQR